MSLSLLLDTVSGSFVCQSGADSKQLAQDLRQRQQTVLKTVFDLYPVDVLRATLSRFTAAHSLVGGGCIMQALNAEFANWMRMTEYERRYMSRIGSPGLDRLVADYRRITKREVMETKENAMLQVTQMWDSGHRHAIHEELKHYIATSEKPKTTSVEATPPVETVRSTPAMVMHYEITPPPVTIKMHMSAPKSTSQFMSEFTADVWEKLAR